MNGERESNPCRIIYRSPFDWGTISSFLARRSIAGVESWTESAFTRGSVRIENDATAGCLKLSMPVASGCGVRDAALRARDLFDTDADPQVITTHLKRDRLLRSIVREHPGIRVPGAWDPFELAVRAVVGQQVSVAAATTILTRLVRRFGHFPAPSELSKEKIDGMPRERAATLSRLAFAVESGELLLERGSSLEESVARLTSIRGIGRWTANYVAMRALREPDAFPSGDLVLQREVGVRSERELLRLAEKWRPWRAYATMLLWSGHVQQRA